jgi:predicted nucleic acid-binding protein
MHTLLDTNVLLRSSQPSSPHHFIATAAVNALLDANRVLCISSQTIYEFLAVATRSLAENGLAMKQADADAQLTALLAGNEVLYDSFAVASEMLVAYIILLTIGMRGTGPAASAVVQATGQKVIVYAAILTVLIQSLHMRRRGEKLIT